MELASKGANSDGSWIPWIAMVSIVFCWLCLNEWYSARINRARLQRWAQENQAALEQQDRERQGRERVLAIIEAQRRNRGRFHPNVPNVAEGGPRWDFVAEGEPRWDSTRNWGDSQHRAQELLERMLTERQLVDLANWGYFWQRGTEGGTYLIDARGKVKTVVGEGDTAAIEAHCVYPINYDVVPPADIALAVLLAIRCNEQYFRKVSVISPNPTIYARLRPRPPRPVRR